MVKKEKTTADNGADTTGLETIGGAFKTTTVRLPQKLFDRCELFAGGLGLNMTEYIREAVEAHNAKNATNPKIVNAAKRRVAEAQRVLREIEGLADA